jgi:hypothetical protein
MKRIIVAAVMIVVSLVILGVAVSVAALGGVGQFWSMVGASTTPAQVGALHVEDRSIPAGGVRAASVALKIGEGTVHVGGGAPGLMRARFTYNVADWRPAVSYGVTRAVAHVAVEQPTTHDIFRGGDAVRNEWDVRLGNQVPLNLSVDEGAGTNTLRLRGLSLTALEVNAGVGVTTLDLGGAWTRSFTAHVRGASGDLTILLPSRVGARVVVHHGLGSISAGGLHAAGDTYVNDAYGTTPVAVDVRIDTGMGDITLATQP